MNVPQLRFSGFDGEWETVSLGKLGDFTKGMALSKADISEEGEPCILYGELYTKYGPVINQVQSRTNSNQSKRVLGTKNDVLIPSSGETAIDIACASALEAENVLLGGDLNIFRPKENVSGVFLSYQINGVRKFKLSKLAQGASVVHLYSNSLKKFKVKIPTYEEQQKIANLLKSLDRKIEKQQEKVETLEQYKKGMVQKIFSQELRFKDEDDVEFPEWEMKKLDKCLDIENGFPFKSSYFTTESLGMPLLRIRDIKAEKLNTYYTGSFDEKYLVDNQDIIIGMDGEFAVSKWDKGPALLNQRVMRIKSKEEYSLSYLYQLLKIVVKKIEDITPKTTVKHLSNKDIFNTVVEMPSFDEQLKIGNFFSDIDTKIGKEKDKLMVLEEQKKGLMQVMFV
ncbi:restriction endonuclease subunit S [Planomicrobium okeanokoites]|uniref:restriction endonuclease subunit S n=1 Tax=Planomicrobium okeanokoites TaxID=244 RepID=UPI0030F4D8CD